MSMSKTAAIAQARKHVGMPIRRSSTDYVVYGPYRVTQPNGASTSSQHSSWPRALAARSARVAEVALALMGYSNDDLAEVYFTHFTRDYGTPGDVNSLVEEGLRQIAKAKARDERHRTAVAAAYPHAIG